MKKTLLAIILSFSVLMPAYASKEGQYTISGISSGGFMANQMATIYSSHFTGVATVAGGFYYCAQNHLQKMIKKDAGTIGTLNLFLFEPTPDFLSFQPQKGNPIYQSVGVCMGHPEKAQQPVEYLKDNVAKKLIDPLVHLERQKVFIYHGKADSVLKIKMQDELKRFYQSVGVKPENIVSLIGQGSHNFPTDRLDGIPCDSEKVPYVASCDLDLAKKILVHLHGNGKKLKKADFHPENIYLVDQSKDLSNKNKAESEWLSPETSLAPYGYLYASDKCLKKPGSCGLHVALHGCKMSDSYNEEFQERYQNQVSFYRLLNMRSKQDRFPPYFNLPVIEEKTNKFGLLKFVRDSGYINYAEENDLMILFPQTWITENNYPYNPKGCWDWFGWTGEDYATNKGTESKWLMDFIHSIASAPKNHILKRVPADLW